MDPIELDVIIEPHYIDNNDKKILPFESRKMVERTYLNRDFIEVGVRNGPSKFIRVMVDLPKEVKHQQ